MPLDAIQVYHDLLTDQLAAETQGQLDVQQSRHNLVFGTRPLCTVLRPRFLTVRQYAFLQTRIRGLLRAFGKAHEAAMEDRAFRAQFGLTPAEDQLLAHSPGFDCASPTSRFDAFFVSEQELKFTEYNAETPAAPAYTDALAEVFSTTPILREFSRTYRLIPLPGRVGVHHALMSAYRQFAGTVEQPRIAILDWREVPTYSEFVLFREYFQAHGLECEIVDPREVEYRNGKLYGPNGYHITLIYKRVLINELLERGGITHPVVKAVTAGAVCMVNPFRCKILYKKASFAVVSDEANARLFTDEERELIKDHIPWTRVVCQRTTQFHGQAIDLVPYLLDHREQFVLKPNDDYGGKGIVLGWTVERSAWESALKTALTEPYVAQEKITLPTEPFPSLTDGKVAITERMLDTAPFVVHRSYVDSCLTRISTDPLLNVTAGGGSTVPTFVIEKRV